jgi:RNA polymerase sigma-70 factor (TIGR02960 family)
MQTRSEIHRSAMTFGVVSHLHHCETGDARVWNDHLVTGGAVDTRELSLARAGDQAAFERLVEHHRRELHIHCYRMLGSTQDAEDMVQETLMAAWRGLEAFEGRATLRTWLYRIATNACLGVVRRGRPAREIPPPPEPPGDYPAATRTTSEPLWLEPYPDAWVEDLPDSTPGPDARYDSRESIELAFVVALQQLSPRERAAVVLKDVLGFRSAETAELLETTEASVNSALQRARDKLDRISRDRRGTDPPRPGSAAERDLVGRFARAFESGDVGSVVELLSSDARLTMPPEPVEYLGPAAIHRFLSTVPARGRLDRFKLVATRANGQPAFACYLRTHERPLRAYGFMVLTLSRDRVVAITGFPDTSVFASFGLPLTLAE